MRPLRALLIYIAVVFLGGALLAPWLFQSLQSLAGQFPSLGRVPFHRVLDRAFLVLALVGLWPLLRALGATSLREIGLPNPLLHSHKFARGFLLGVLTLALVGGLTYAAGVVAFKQTLTVKIVVGKMFSAAATALAVAVLEEILFRGGIFSGLRRVFHWKFAMIAASVVYAAVHFLKSSRDDANVTWLSGLHMLTGMFGDFTSWHEVIPGFINLTLIGVLLCLAYQRTGDLYSSMGLHAGWIFALKLFSALLKETPAASSWFWAQGNMLRGWLTLLMLVAMLAVSSRLWPTRRNRYA